MPSTNRADFSDVAESLNVPLAGTDAGLRGKVIWRPQDVPLSEGFLVEADAQGSRSSGVIDRRVSQALEPQCLVEPS